MTYRDREEAAQRLADALVCWPGSNPLVVAIPRGAVPMALVIARRLQGDLDVVLVLVRKLHARGNPELAIGAVDESGWTYVAPHAEWSGASRSYIDQQKHAELATLRDRRQRYTPDRGAIAATPHLRGTGRFTRGARAGAAACR